MNAFWSALRAIDAGDPNYPDAAAATARVRPHGDRRPTSACSSTPGGRWSRTSAKQECAFWRAHYDAEFAGDAGGSAASDAGTDAPIASGAADAAGD